MDKMLKFFEQWVLVSTIIIGILCALIVLQMKTEKTPPGLKYTKYIGDLYSFDDVTIKEAVFIKKGYSNQSRFYNLRAEISDEMEAKLESIPGVQNVFTHNRYELNIYKGAAFTWNEVEPKVIGVIYSILK